MPTLTQSHQVKSSQTSAHFLVLDSLRGVLALWVILGHIGEFSAYGIEDSPAWMHLILRPALAVDVFMLLSGFVIARLIIEKAEPYRAYIIRRFCRLWPAFMVILCFSILTLPLVRGTLAWHAAQMNQDEAISFASVTQHFWGHLAADLPMLQGLVPQNLLPNGSFGFLTPAWSISLEWQFYLVAPMLLLVLRQRPALIALVLVGCLVVAPGLEHFYPIHSILPAKLALFALGILSFWFFKAVGHQISDLPVALGVGALAMQPAGITWTIWLGAMALVFSKPVTPWLGNLARWAVHPVLVWLGSISFSLYLVHYPLLRLSKAWAIQLGPERSRESMALFLLASALPLTLVCAWALYTLVEKPGIALGKKLTSNRNRAYPNIL